MLASSWPPASAPTCSKFPPRRSGTPADVILWIAAAVQSVVVALDIGHLFGVAPPRRHVRSTDAVRAVMSPLEIGGLGIAGAVRADARCRCRSALP